MISKALTGVLCLASFTFAQEVKVEITYQKFVLPNGLTLLVHEDRKAPIVAVNVWYHVGSKNEVRGRTGFAHLFEHLMFNGTEHNNNDYFKVLEKLGATDLNGTTNEDRTNYFQNVPTNALDTVLWMESDRMGHLVGVIDQARLDEQRGVVQNEKRQGENEPYGMVDLLSYEYSFPTGHPYSWSVIGSMDDLNAASLKDVKEWFAKYYGPTNATIVLAGDIDAKTAKEKVEKYFGHIPPGPPLQRPEQWIAKRTGNKKVSLQDRVPQARLYRMWNVPPSDTTELTRLRLFSTILGGGKTSRLYKRLVYRDQIATDASAGIDTREIASIFTVEATARPGLDLTSVEAAVSEEIHDLLTNGPTAEEVKRAQTQFVSNFVRGTERIGGFGGKSDLLAQGQVYAGNPEYYKTVLKDVQSATPADLKQVANAWLADGALDFEVVPYHEYKATTTDADRSKVPEPGPISDSRFPKLERTTLANGLKIVLAERHDTPIVSLVLAVDAGYAADQLSTPGTAKLTASMLEEGTRTRNAIQISEELEGLGARLAARANLDASMVSMSALKVNLDPSLDLFADVILNPSFPETDLARERKQLLAGIAREQVEPQLMGLRLLPSFLYGAGHAYANPLTGSGTEASIKAITRDQLVEFHHSWFHPNNATLIVVGDTTLAEMKPKLEKAFGSWARGQAPAKNLAKVSLPDKSVVYLMDRPGSLQSVIFASSVAPPRADPNEIALQTLNTSLGGAFVSRLNMNLREDKHWSYGSFSLMLDARGQRPFIAIAPVQTDKTKESMAEMNKEFRELLKARPITAEELVMARDNQTLSLPGSRETGRAVAANVLEMVEYGLPEDYFDTYAGKVRALTVSDMSTAAERLVHPDSLVWVVVGDREKIEVGVRELKLGEVRLIDAEGNPVK